MSLQNVIDFATTKWRITKENMENRKSSGHSVFSVQTSNAVDIDAVKQMLQEESKRLEFRRNADKSDAEMAYNDVMKRFGLQDEKTYQMYLAQEQKNRDIESKIRSERLDQDCELEKICRNSGMTTGTSDLVARTRCLICAKEHETRYCPQGEWHCTYCQMTNHSTDTCGARHAAESQAARRSNSREERPKLYYDCSRSREPCRRPMERDRDFHCDESVHRYRYDSREGSREGPRSYPPREVDTRRNNPRDRSRDDQRRDTPRESDNQRSNPREGSRESPRRNPPREIDTRRQDSRERSRGPQRDEPRRDSRANSKEGDCRIEVSKATKDADVDGSREVSKDITRDNKFYSQYIRLNHYRHNSSRRQGSKFFLLEVIQEVDEMKVTEETNIRRIDHEGLPLKDSEGKERKVFRARRKVKDNSKRSRLPELPLKEVTERLIEVSKVTDHSSLITTFKPPDPKTVKEKTVGRHQQGSRRSGPSQSQECFQYFGGVRLLSCTFYDMPET